MSSASQYYQLLPSLKDLVTYIQQKICATSDPSCQTQAASLLSATYVDIDFDTISHALVFNGFWDRAPDAESWTETISLRQETDHIEVGVLTSEKAVDPEDLAFSGFLTVIGKDSKPSTHSNPPLLILYSLCRLTIRPRPNTLLLPSPPPSPPLQRPIHPTTNLHNLFPPPHRSPPNSPPRLPLRLPDSSRRNLRSAHLPHAPRCPLHRQVPAQRPALPVLATPHQPTQPKWRHRPRGAHLGSARMGLSRAARARRPAVVPSLLFIRLQAGRRLDRADPAASALPAAEPQRVGARGRRGAVARRVLGVSRRGGRQDGGEPVRSR